MAEAELIDVQGKEGALKILLLGDGRGDLGGVRREFQAIIKIFWPLEIQGYLHANFLVGRNLTIQNVKSKVLATPYTIIHYAGHTRENGRILPFAYSYVDTREFIGIISQNPPTLLVMDACNSLGDPEKWDLATPLFTLSGAVFGIGTSSILRDDLPREIFPKFYEGLIRGRSFGDALNDAERKHWRDCEAYNLFGDPSLTLH